MYLQGVGRIGAQLEAERIAGAHDLGFDRIAEFGCEFIGVGDDLLDVAVFIDELGSSLIADTRNTGQIV